MNNNKHSITDNDIIEYVVTNDDTHLRREIDSLRASDRAFNERVQTWENVLFGLHEHETKHVTPPEHVWKNIEQDLFADKTPSKSFFSNWFAKLAIPTIVAITTFFMVKNTAHTDGNMTAQVMMQDTMIWDIESDGEKITFHNMSAIPNAEKVKCLVWAKIKGELYALGDVPDNGSGDAKTLSLPQNLQAQHKKLSEIELIIQDTPMDEFPDKPDLNRNYLVSMLTRRS